MEIEGEGDRWGKGDRGKEIVGNGIEGDGDSWKWDYRGRK